MRSKLTTLQEAVALVADGATVALGGNTLHRAPIAAVHELVRQGKRGLNIVKTAGRTTWICCAARASPAQ